MDGPSEISGNRVEIRGSDNLTGIRTDFSDGSSLSPILIANNFVAQTGTNNDVVRGMFIYHGSNQIICYNSIHVTGGDINDGRALYLTTYGSTYTGNVKVKNNVAVNSGPGVAIYTSYNVVSNNMISECDYNNYYVSGATLTKYNGISEATLSDWQMASGWDLNSHNLNPQFTSPSDLHTGNYSLDATGNPVLQILVDIDGDIRDSSNPDIGADEFSLPGPLNGSYVIDQNGSGDYTSFTEAVTNAVLLGVDGPVVFNVMAGTYNEKLILTEIGGTSASNTVTFTAASGDSSSVILTNSYSTYNDNYTVLFDGADYITFDHITLTTDVVWSYCRVVEFTNTAIGNTIQNCLVYGLAYNSHSTDYAVIFSDGSNDDFTSINNNIINGGSYGIYMKGIATTIIEDGLEISNNVISSFSARGILAHFQENVIIKNNTIESNPENETYNYVYGIWAGFCDGNSELSGNQIQISGYDKNYGLYLNYCDGSALPGILIFNNSVVLSGTSTASNYGLYSFNGMNQHFYYNSVLMNTGGTGSSAAYFTCLSTNSSGGLVLKNNSLSNITGGRAIYLSATALTNSYVTASDYNNFHSNGAILGKLGNFDPPDLTTWQLMSGWDANSLSVVPNYMQNDNLHISSSSLLIGAGNPITGISSDIDGDLRDVLTPCIGSDETLVQTVIPDTQLISFPMNWSIFSTYLVPLNPLIDSTFQTVHQNIILMKDDNGLVYWPPFVALLDSLTLGEGYLIKMSSSDSLLIIGTAAVPENYLIQLPAGWSMFGYLRQAAAPLVNMLTTIATDIIIIKDGDGNIYWPLYGVDLIGNLEPGKGYQVKLSQAAGLTFPAN
jgi:parallel beta-helix repeat protein